MRFCAGGMTPCFDNLNHARLGGPSYLRNEECGCKAIQPGGAEFHVESFGSESIREGATTGVIVAEKGNSPDQGIRQHLGVPRSHVTATGRFNPARKLLVNNGLRREHSADQDQLSQSLQPCLLLPHSLVQGTRQAWPQYLWANADGVAPRVALNAGILHTNTA